MISEKESGPSYKAFVGKGNNSILIKNVIKSRPWWILSQDGSEVNLHWTQVKSAKFTESLKEGSKSVALEWEKGVKSRLYLLNEPESLSEKSKEELGVGFHKLLSQT